MLNRVKLALRITTSYLDDEIRDCIEEATLEMVRSGVPADVAKNEDNALVARAVKTYCQATLTGDLNARDKYHESFLYQLDCIRKSSMEEVSASV